MIFTLESLFLDDFPATWSLILDDFPFEIIDDFPSTSSTAGESMVDVGDLHIFGTKKYMVFNSREMGLTLFMT